MAVALSMAALAGALDFIQAWLEPRTSPPGAKAGGAIALNAFGCGQERRPAAREVLRCRDDLVLRPKR